MGEVEQGEQTGILQGATAGTFCRKGKELPQKQQERTV